MLWTLAEAVTLNGAPATLLAGLLTATLFTLMSAEPVIFVLEPPPALLFPGVGSLTWSWSTAIEAVAEKLWLEAPVQLTDQLAPLTVVAVDVASDVSCTVCGFAELVVQSAGMLRLNVVSAFTGPYAPLLWTLADAVTLNGAPAAFEAGDDTVTLFTFRSDVRVTDQTALLLAELFADAGSLTWSWSREAEAVTVSVWLDGSVHVTDQLAGLPGTVVAVDTAREVFCTVCGLADEVVQSAGRLSVNVVSTFAGP